jgi:glycosyltransferase involved in cell wall biosynthesis
MQVRRNARSVPGGDFVHAIKTMEYLRRLGVEADISEELRPDLRGYDVVHLFVLDFYFYENYVRLKNAKKNGKCVVLSPIYWNMHDFHALLSKGSLKNRAYYSLPDGIMREMVSNVLNRTLTRELFRTYVKNVTHVMSKKHQQVELLKSCDMIVPNSVTEKELMMRDFGIRDSGQFLVVPNAADKSFQYANGRSFESRYGIRDFVMCAGRIAPEKNQLSLIRAVKGTGMKLVLVGFAKETFKDYYGRCKQEADGDVLFLPWLPHHELASAYGAAKVHALPSWRETPGLSSLEAGLAGCNIVTTSIGSTEEYFGKYAWYCEPDSIESIRKAVEEAFVAPRSSALRERILDNFTWEKAAERTLHAYELAIGRSGAPCRFSVCESPSNEVTAA